jgi:serine/threonine protein phosphatase PrpC
MKFPDPILLKSQIPGPRVVFASSQLTGKQNFQTNYFINFNDECFVVTDGHRMARGDVASTLAAETAIWGYKHVRHRPDYWSEKQLLVRRIFRSTNLAIWQKHREPGFEEGLQTTLSVAIIGPNKIWVGSVGDTSRLLYRESLIDILTPTNADMLGLKRLGLVPHVKIDEFLGDDILLMATAGAMKFVSEDALRTACEMAGDTTQSVTGAVVHLLETAQENGSEDNMTVCIMKRLKSGGE